MPQLRDPEEVVYEEDVYEDDDYEDDDYEDEDTKDDEYWRELWDDIHFEEWRLG